LNALGFQVIEVYPYATKVLLLGDKATGKTSVNLDFLKAGASVLIPDLLYHVDNFGRNDCDAALNTYTGFLYLRNQTDILADSPPSLRQIGLPNPSLGNPLCSVQVIKALNGAGG